MSGKSRPDDVSRSPSGRVPKWVMDEANGMEPTELVPFRGSTTSLAQRRRQNRRHRRNHWAKLTLALVVAGGLLALAAATDTNSTANPFAATASPKARRDGPPPGQDENEHPAHAPAPLVGTPSTKYRLLAHQEGKVTPVTWSPCRPIHYVVRPDHAPVGGSQLLDEAFARLSQATGLSFINDGQTSEAPVEDRSSYQKGRYGDRWVPVLVTWATADEVPDFGIDIAGEAGPQQFATPSGDSTYVTGTVALDPATFTQLLQRRGAQGSRSVQQQNESIARSIILHELGHLVGLAHVNDSGQIMAPRGGKVTDYQAGDLAGLALLGKGSCQPDV